MGSLPQFDKKLALYLLDLCSLTYTQYEHDGHFHVPKKGKLIKTFKAKAFGSLEWFGFILETDDSVFIAFRGTDSDPDWIADATFYQSQFPYVKTGVLVHDGFLDIYDSCRDDIIQTYATIPKNKKLYITGHSLGGALATLHALDVAANMRFSKVIMYNFASPRVGNKEFTEIYNNLIPLSIRFVNTNDIIPMLPPETIHCPISNKIWHYSHIHSPLTFSIQSWSIGGNHSLDVYIKGVEDL